ncbi:hypothetical protein OG758_20350 [Streptomyces sp. NBC_01474]|uniref:hypothetical protein n=1 Tax=unclassified Streptomyces TaxID=2593676 RepID=UPI002DD8B1E1|nr:MULTISPECIES: hypothetical protein [unclassified Streptomyces]WSE01937.1 hypothetical protein OG758_20350 [Streptomyces sp. NBC_01474]
MPRTRPRLLHGTLINRHGFAGRPGRPPGDNGIGHLHGFDHACHSTGHLHGTTGSFSRHHIGNGRAFAGTLIGTSARNRRPVTRALTVPGEGLCGIGHIP